MLSLLGSLSGQGSPYNSLLHFDGNFTDANSSNLWRSYLQVPYGNSAIVNKSVSALTTGDGYETTFDGEKSFYLPSGLSCKHFYFNSAFATTNDVLPADYYGDFTISVHARVIAFADVVGSLNNVIVGLCGGTSVDFKLSAKTMYDDGSGAYYINYVLTYVRKKQDGSTVTRNISTPMLVFSSNAWNYIKIGKKGTMCFLILNGTKYSDDIGVEHKSYNTNSRLCVAGNPFAPYGSGLHGYIDEVCLRVGIGDDTTTIQQTPF